MTSDQNPAARAVGVALRRRLAMYASIAWLVIAAVTCVVLYVMLVLTLNVSGLFAIALIPLAIGGVAFLTALAFYFVHGVATGTLGDK